MTVRSRDALLALFEGGDRLYASSFRDLIDTLFDRTTGGSPSDKVIDEVPTGALNGINLRFTTAFNFVPETLEVYINGVKQRRTDDYTNIGVNQFDFGIALPAGTEITVTYVKAAT